MNPGPPKHVRIEFDRLIREYLENLKVTLRGFKAAEEFDFLAAFVPSEDATDSLLELITLAREAGIARLTVVVGADTWAVLDTARVRAAADHQTREHADGQRELDFILDAGAAAALDIHPCYEARLTEVLTNVTHEGSLAPAEGQVLVSAESEDVTLAALVSPAGRRVTRASFVGAATPVRRGLMELLCATMEGRPIQECADHAVIVVEHTLRDRTQPPPVPGTVTPDSAGPAFALPQTLVRGLLAEYRTAAGYTGTENTFASPPSEQWRKLSAQQRQDAVRDAIDRKGMGDKVTVVAIDGLKRVVVLFTADLAGDVKQSLLVELEEQLHRTVEPTLQLVAQAKADANVIRLPERKKSP